MGHYPVYEHEGKGAVAEAEAVPKLKKPPLYRVLLLNDDFTPMDFVVAVLVGFFYMPEAKAIQVMWQIHIEGKGVCGVYTREIAETKVSQVNGYARSHHYPLLCTMEKVEEE